MSKFEPLFPEMNKKKKSVSKRQTLKQKKEEERIRDEELGKENLSKLEPMVAPLLVFKASQNQNEWLVKSAKAVLEQPHLLTEKWINGLNKWALEMSNSMSLDQPELKVKERYFFENKKITKIIPPKETQAFPSYAIMAEDEKGWKFYFKSSKAKMFKEGYFISFKATVKSHDEGITFLSRASSIKEVMVIQSGEIDDD
jgi:hypothetical protein